MLSQEIRGRKCPTKRDKNLYTQNFTYYKYTKMMKKLQ